MTSETSATPRQGRNLVAATTVGIGLLGLLALALVLPPTALTILLGVLLFAAYVEIGGVLADHDRRMHVDVLMVATTVLLVATQLLGTQGQGIGLIVLAGGAFLRSLADRDRTNVVETVALTILFGLWLGGFASFAVLLRALDQPVVLLVSILGAAAVGDIGAYAIGSWVGRRPIAPTVSPKKTWEGFLGGLACSGLWGAAVLPLDGSSTVGRGLLIGFAVGLAGFLGDLIASMAKRDLGIKDFGRLLPGHGGVLDRVDGLLVALPVGYVLVAILP